MLDQSYSDHNNTFWRNAVICVLADNQWSIVFLPLLFLYLVLQHQNTFAIIITRAEFLVKREGRQWPKTHCTAQETIIPQGVNLYGDIRLGPHKFSSWHVHPFEIQSANPRPKPKTLPEHILTTKDHDLASLVYNEWQEHTEHNNMKQI